jgi:mRNA interferase RelE/StbE
MKNIKTAITKAENSQSINELTSIKHLSNSGPYYRIKIGDFRIGIKYENNTISFIRCLHRKDIYRKFP